VSAAPTRAAPTARVHELVLRPRSGWIPVDWGEIWRSREIFYFFVWRDLKARYKQAVLGVGWAVIQPLIALVLLTTIGSLARIDKHVGSDVPYALFVYTGLVPWLFCANAINNGGRSLVQQQTLLTKIYLPRVFIPGAVVGAAAFDMLISVGILGGLMAFYRFVPSWQIVLVPLLLLLTFLVVLGFVLFLSALTLIYRDLRVIIPFIVQLGMWCSAVFYPASMFGRHQWILMLNPIAGLIGAFRSAIFGMPWEPQNVAVSGLLAVAMFVFGLYYFRRCERRFADIV
jgi:homopolymeric O-antigen transport system permease protein